jgi:large subunit ribosomal protein L9
MKVILLAKVDRLGKAGEIVEVAPGYGRNYLIPQGYAEALTKKGKKEVEVRRRQAEKWSEMELETAHELAARIENQSFDVKAKTGARGKLYGSITTIAVADAISKATGRKIDKRQISFPEPIKMLGGYNAEIKLHPEIKVIFQVNVIPAEGSKMERT